VTRKSPPPTFEQALSELESIVAKMEKGELSLEESLKTFERGIELTRYCESTLNQAEQRVRILAAGSAAEAELEPFQRAEQ
jgi:exodeoxyribonuclease VII small subunit